MIIIIKNSFFLNCLMIAGLIQASPVSVDLGGSGITSATAYAVLCGGIASVNPLQSIASVGTSGQALLSNGDGSLPTFQTLILAEYAHVYSTAASSITSGSNYLFNSNGLISSGISHSTSSNTDRITVNTAGTYQFIYFANTAASTSFISISVDGVLQVPSKYSFGGSGGERFLMGCCILTLTAGQIIRVVNSGGSTMTLSNTNSMVSAAITIMQIL
jgi:hypothetical protein